MKKKIKVYIASPYTKGDVGMNVKRQLDTADELISLGFQPFAPLYYHFQHIAHPRGYKEWLDLCKGWIPEMDCLLRLEGDSKGADEEVALAESLGIKVFHNTVDLDFYYYNR